MRQMSQRLSPRVKAFRRALRGMPALLFICAALMPADTASAASIAACGPMAGALGSAVMPVGDSRFVFSRGTDGKIYETWYSGRWRGPLGMRWQTTTAPGVATGHSGHQYVFWRGGNGHVYEAWYIGGWRGPVDRGWGAASAPGVAVNPANNHQFVFWRGNNGHLYEAWYTDRWRGPVDMRWQVSSAPSVGVGNDEHQYLFWRGANGRVYAAWYVNGWHGPVEMGWQTSSAPSAAVNPLNDHQYVFWQASNGHVYAAWNTGRWRGPIDMRWQSSATPSVAVGNDEHQYVFWQGQAGEIYEAWNDGRWHGPALRVAAPVLRRGSSGPAVCALQSTLARFAYLPSSAVDGTFGARTWHAVVAFQGWTSLARDGVVGARTRDALSHASRPTPWSTAEGIEIHIAQQVLLLIRNGVTERAIHVSTGAGGATPLGHYRIYRREVMSWSYSFHVWMPLAQYFYGGYAMHEYPDVPGYPASHGCVRLPAEEAPTIWKFGRLGMRVWTSRTDPPAPSRGCR